MSAADALSNTKVKEEVFHRKIFYQCCDFLENSRKSILVLSGPRKCGKTFCLRQLSSEFGYDYYNFKNLNTDEAEELLLELISREEGVILLDEVTYVEGLFQWISKLDEIKFDKPNLKFIIAGSQSYALYVTVSTAAGANAEFIRTSFIDFEEWLVYQNKISYGDSYEPTEDDFLDYISGGNVFTGILDNLDYIDDCVHETIVSESKSFYAINGIAHGTSDVSTVALFFMYMSLFDLHNRRSYVHRNEYPNSLASVRISGGDDIKYIKRDVFMNRIYNELDKLIIKVKRLSVYDICNALRLLEQADLITIVEVSDDKFKLEKTEFLQSNNTTDITLSDLFDCINVVSKNPIFHINMLHEVLYELQKEQLVKFLPKDLIGSIYECIIRGLFTYQDETNYQVEFQYDGGEIDYVNLGTREAIEISVGKNHTTKHFSMLPDSFDKYIITASTEEFIGNIKNMNYLTLLLKLSRGNFVKRIIK